MAGFDSGAVSSGVTTTAVVKANDDTVNNSATLQDDSELLTALEANSTYVIDVGLLHTTSFAASIKFSFSVPSGSVLARMRSTIGNSSGAVTDLSITDAGSMDTEGFGAAEITLTRMYARVETGATAGNFVIQFAQVNAEVSNTILQAGSHLVVWKVG